MCLLAIYFLHDDHDGWLHYIIYLPGISEKKNKILVSDEIMEGGTENGMTGNAGDMCEEYGFYISSWGYYHLGC